MKLSEISFPVFRLTNRKPEFTDGIWYYVSESFNSDTAEYSVSVRVVDDNTLPYDSLSRRRLALKGQESVKLYPLRKAVYFLADLVKLAKSGYWWVDSLGKVFEYKKSTRAKLRFYKIENIFPLNGMGAVIAVEGHSARFKVLYRPNPSVRYAGVIEGKIGEVFLYGLYDDKQPDSWRMI